MEVLRGHPRPLALPSSVVAIGNFDGVHLGHRALLATARQLAGQVHSVVALTFDPHPAEVIGKAAPVALCSLARRLELLAEAGVDITVVEPFTAELAAQSARDFVDVILIGGLRARGVVVGYDFAYGALRSGTTATLAAQCEANECSVAVVPPVLDGDAPISSSRIRAALKAGELASANALLGRRFDVDGVVVHGAKRGRTIGIPTANVRPDTGTLPIAGGIYAVLLSVEGDAPRAAVASFGTNPTFVTSTELVLEVHVLDFDGDLYDRHVRVTFVAWLRPEQVFDGVESLLAQIHQDIAQARAQL